MRLLYFITFFVAILFSEVVTHVVTWDESVSVLYEMPGDDSNESENGEESNEDQLEEGRLFNYTELNTFIKSVDVLVLPYTNSRLSQQSLKEIDIPPPDLI